MSRAAFASLTALALVAACSPSGPMVTSGVAPAFSPPAFSPPAPDSLTLARILQAIDSATFDTAAGAGDRQPLMVGTCPRCSYGPLAVIQPERDSWYHSRDSLAHGRIVARLINRDARTDYPKFGLRAGSTVYWWVDSVPGGWRAVFVDRTLRAAPVVARMVIDRHPPDQWKQGIARWVWVPNDELAWVTCSKDGCCKTDGETQVRQ